MAYTYTINNSWESAVASVYRLKTALLAGGWTIRSSSDGTTYNAAGDQITSSSTGTGGLNNARAWFVIRQPGTNQREFCFQRSSDTSTTTTNWRVKYSGGPGTGFSGGTPSSTQVPSATDEQIIFGSGTDATPTFSVLFDATLRANILVGDAANNYNFLFWTQVPASSQSPETPRATMFLDTITSPSVGDPDPAVLLISSSSGSPFTGDLLSTTSGPQTWILKGQAGAGFVRTPILTWGTSTTSSYIPGAIGAHTLTYQYLSLPLLYGRNSAQTAPTGWKGVSSLFELMVTTQSFGAMHTRTTTNDRLVLGNVSIPWNGSNLEF